MKNLGVVLRALRSERKLSLLTLHDQTKIAASHLSNIETGKKRPSLEVLDIVAKNYDIPLSEIFVMEEQITKIQSSYVEPLNELNLHE